MAEQLKTEHFVRTAPIPAQDRRTHFCFDLFRREFYVMCAKKRCEYFHPELPQDEGSCALGAKNSTKLEAAIKKAKDRKEKKKKEKVKMTCRASTIEGFQEGESGEKEVEEE